MQHLLVEIKARCPNPEKVRRFLLEQQADFRGKDHQIDTYFKIEHGRLKLREGTIERSLIYYDRPNQLGPKDSHVSLSKMQTIPSGLRDVLHAAIGIKVVVDKKREIYFIGNVKFHIDEVPGLGTFVEIEAIGSPGIDAQADLLQQCQQYMAALDIKEDALVAHSYSDLLLQY